MKTTPEIKHAAGSRRSPAHCSAWRVPASSTAFGTMLHTGMSDGILIVMYRGNHGWRTGEGWNAFAHLPHQLYTEKLQPIVDLRPREIVAVNLHSGEWVTIWARDSKEIRYQATK